MSEESLFERACALAGIEPGYQDAWGRTCVVSDTVRARLLAVMGIADSDPAALAPSLESFETWPWRRALAPLVVVAEHDRPIRVPCVLNAGRAVAPVGWTLDLDGGGCRTGSALPSSLALIGTRLVDGEATERRELAFDGGLPIGYHALRLRFADGTEETGQIAVAPASCYMPPVLEGGGRIWGVSLQLYALRSRRNWGIGDFSDLAAVAATVARLGGGAIGLNPLHALFPGEPERASPYSPSTRRFHNVFYVDVEAVPEFRDCAEARARVAAPGFQDRLAALRAAPLVDYAGTAACKLEVLESLYRWFRVAHLAKDTRRARAFRRFQRLGGQTLELIGAYHALADAFGDAIRPLYDWRAWPQDYRRPDAPAVAAYAAANRERVEYVHYLLWQAETQFERVVRACARLGMPIGIGQDLALSVDPGGGEAWIDQDVLARGVSLGAPPDELSLKGQVWGLPPYDPHALGRHGWAPFIATLRANMAQGGALRIDHVLGLARQFWVPENTNRMDAGQAGADAGGYVQNAFAALIGLVALESHRSRCLVIGEDLGTLPGGLRERLHEARILSYRLLYFERDEGGAFLPPERYPALALAAVGTHDLPPFAGWWTGRDLDLREALGQFPRPELAAESRSQRGRDRAMLLGILDQPGLAEHRMDGRAPSLPSRALVEAVYAYLARAPSALLMVHLEDALDVADPVNVPGTLDEHPNWRRKLPIGTDDLARDPRLAALAAGLRAARPVPRAE